MPFRTTDKMYIIEDFQGMIQRQDIDKIPENYSPLLVNISLAKPGTWAKRKGTDLLATTQAGNGVFGGIEFKKNDGTHVVRAVRSRDLDTYSTATDTYTQIDATQFTASTFVSSVNYIGWNTVSSTSESRVYHISPSDFLCYETGSTCTDVGTGDDRIKANQLVVAQNTLFVCGVSYGVGATQTWQDRVYFSLYDLTNNVPGDQLWETSEGDLASSTRFFSLLAPHKASFAYNGLSYHFTEEACFEFDLAIETVRKVFNIGCASTRAVCECNGWMIWMSPDKRLWAWGGSGTPIPLSWALEDDGNEEAFINKISDSNVSSVACGSLRNEFWFSVGDVTNLGVTITNACLRGLITQNLDSVLWSVDSYPVKPAIFFNANFNGKQVLLFGASGVDDIYQMQTGTDDVGSTTTAINAYARTAYIDFTGVLLDKYVSDLYIKYRPQTGSDTFLKVGYARDGSLTYTTISDPDGGTPVTQYGTVDMYKSTASTDRNDNRFIRFPKQSVGENMSIELGNAQVGESFEIQAIGIKETKELPLNIKPGS